MAKQENSDLVVGLDIGTSRMVAIVAERTSDGSFEIIGVGSHASRGIRRGVVVDIESTTQSIERAVEEAELMAACEIRSVTASISGSHISCQNSYGMSPIRDKEVDHEDMVNVLRAAKAVNLPADRYLLHVLPQEYIIDEQDGIHHPLGMTGVRLGVKAHLVTCAMSAVQNIRKCISRCGLELDGLIAQQLASASSVLNEDERELGVCLVDIGAGTTDIAVFHGGSLRHTAVIPIAGDQVSNDIAVALRTPTQCAEDLKIKYACALAQLASSDENIQVPSVGERPPRRLARQTLAEVVQPRYEELFSLVQDELRRSGLEDVIAAGVVLTGGSSRMEGVCELAEEIFHMPVRIGIPMNVSGLTDVVANQVHATAVGLVQWQENNMEQELDWQRNAEGFWEKLKIWFRGEF